MPPPEQTRTWSSLGASRSAEAEQSSPRPEQGHDQSNGQDHDFSL